MVSLVLVANTFSSQGFPLCDYYATCQPTLLLMELLFLCWEPLGTF